MLRKQDQKGGACTFVYELAGRLTRRDYRTQANSPSGTIADSDVFTYDKASRMLTAVSGRYTNTVTSSYDTAGRKKTEGLTISGKTYTTTSAYNSRGELTQLTYPDSAVIQRTYTDRGEYYQLKHAGTTVDTRTYDDGGRLVTDAYNNTVTESRTYNLDNSLATTIYAQSGQQTLCDYVAGATPTASTCRYLFASYIDEPVLRITTTGTVATYMHRNQQYSVTALTDAAGTVVERYAYTAYGIPTIAAANGLPRSFSLYGSRYTYTGREWDSSILQYHYRARMFDPQLGRFCSRDPIGYEGSEWNLFEYTSDNPLKRFDPKGTDWLDCMVACMDDALVTNNIARGVTGAAGAGGISVKKKIRLAGPKRTSILTKIGIRTGLWSYPVGSTASKVCGRVFLVIGVADAAAEVYCAGRCASDPNW